jgi:hypothetical protein
MAVKLYLVSHVSGNLAMDGRLEIVDGQAICGDAKRVDACGENG